MGTPSKPVVIVTGGGTGGHLYPALALAEAIRDLAEVHYAGHPDRIEGKVVPTKSIPFHPIRSVPSMPGLVNRLRLGVSLFSGVMGSLVLMQRLKPALVIGVGGYVSVPVMLAAWMSGRKTLLHEQNVAPGKANRTLARVARMPVMTTFPVAPKYFPDNKVILTGCPVREAFGRIEKAEARRILGIDPGARVVLVVGGSGGAAALNACALALVPLLDAHPELVILHATGRNYYESHMEGLRAKGGPAPRYMVVAYLDESAVAMAASDLMVSRSGASTLSEVFCAGVPSILVPSPNVAENHQHANAVFAEEQGAAIVVPETGDYAAQVRGTVERMLGDAQALQQMADRAKANCRGKEAAHNVEREVAALLAGGGAGG